MGKKKFEQGDEAFYDPFAAEQKRAADRAAGKPVGPVGVGEPTAILERVAPKPKSSPANAAKAPAKPRPEAKKAPVLHLDKPTEAGSLPVARPTGQKQVVQKRFRVTEDEESDFEDFVLRLRKAASSKVDFSVICRSLWTIVQHAEPQILDELKRASVPKRPGKHATMAQAEYEEIWVKALSQALRKMAPSK